MSTDIASSPFPRAARLFGLAAILVAATAVATNLAKPYSIDFVSYWAAGVLALGGNPADAYDLALHRAVQMAAVPIDGLMPFPYPPFVLLLLLPFGLLPYALAAALWTGASA